MSFGLEPLYTKMGVLEEKIKKCLEVFYNQPSGVIAWTPNKRQYAWGIVGPARAERMLHEILNILTAEDKINV